GSLAATRSRSNASRWLEQRGGPMTEGVERSVIKPVNPKLNVSRNANLPHSPGIRVGDYIFLSGMGPVDPVSGGRNLGPIAEQIRQTRRNMAHMLESAGSGLDRIVKMTVVLADAGDYDEMNRVWREFFPVDPPARTACALQLSNGNGVEIKFVPPAGEGPTQGIGEEMIMPGDPLSRPLIEIARELRDRRASARELVEVAIARHERFGDRLHAYSFWTPDQARAVADAADAAFAVGVSAGPLQGLPVSIKDLFAAEGDPCFA